MQPQMPMPSHKHKNILRQPNEYLKANSQDP